eukprot:355040-Chlamydomonas_euryale.AAC.15
MPSSSQMATAVGPAPEMVHPYAPAAFAAAFTASMPAQGRHWCEYGEGAAARGAQVLQQDVRRCCSEKRAGVAARGAQTWQHRGGAARCCALEDAHRLEGGHKMKTWAQGGTDGMHAWEEAQRGMDERHGWEAWMGGMHGMHGWVQGEACMECMDGRRERHAWKEASLRNGHTYEAETDGRGGLCEE